MEATGRTLRARYIIHIGQDKQHLYLTKHKNEETCGLFHGQLPLR